MGWTVDSNECNFRASERSPDAARARDARRNNSKHAVRWREVRLDASRVVLVLAAVAVAALLPATMSFFCSISGEPPQDPVVSSKSGHVYERRLILKYITENGTDPITGDKLEEADLVTVKPSAYYMFFGTVQCYLQTLLRTDPKAAPPRPPNASSIPALLQTLQNEWDAAMLETFALRQQYNSLRQELSYALYAQDAAQRVVARLIKERDAAREYVLLASWCHPFLTVFS